MIQHALPDNLLAIFPFFHDGILKRAAAGDRIGSAFHFDPATGINLALEVIPDEPARKRPRCASEADAGIDNASDDPGGDILATWLCTSPTATARALEALQRHGGPSCVGENSCPPSVDQMNAIAQELGADAIIHHQRHGTVVCVLPGWGHTVINRRPCVKVAVDLVRDTEVHLYAIAWRLHHAVHLHGQEGCKIPIDYPCWLQKVVRMCSLADHPESVSVLFAQCGGRRMGEEYLV